MVEMLPKRKILRLKEYNYNNAGYYYITICTRNRQCILGNVVGSADPCAPHDVNREYDVVLSKYGKVAEKYLLSIDANNDGVKLDKFVIMPNHLHLILCIAGDGGGQGSAHPTKNRLSNIVHGFKRLTNTEYGKDIWQSSYYDHVIRNEQDYLRFWEYIDTNPLKWADDEYYF